MFEKYLKRTNVAKFKATTTALLAASIFALFACSGDNGDTPNPEPSSNSVDTELSSSSDISVSLCAGEEYDPNAFRCEANELIGKCRGQDYYFAYQICNDGVIEERNTVSSSSEILPSSSSEDNILSSSSSEVSSSSVQSSSSVSSSSIFCKSNDLGKGYDVIGSPYINWTEVNNILVLDQDKMCQDGILELDKAGSAQQYASFSGNTIKEFYSKRNESMKISANLGIDIDIAFIFSAKFDAKFAMNTSGSSQQSSSQQFYYSQIRSFLYTGEDQIKGGSASAQNLSKYLTSDFISDLKSTKSAAQILDRYGSHVFIQYYKGGSLEANYTYIGSESSSRFTDASQMELAAKASFGKIDGGINYGTGSSNETSINELEQHMSFNYETYGGNEIKATSMTQLGSEYAGWVSTIRDNARTTGIKDFAQSFIPIWDLAQQIEGVTSTRLNALKDEFKRRAEAQGLKFPVEEEYVSCVSADNTSTHYCSNGVLREYGIVDYEGKAYKTVVIGNQTWMAENLNYNVAGSRCYEDSPDNCTRYGRLYSWTTAMTFNATCETSICTPQINAKHKGICPSGWHLPKNNEWDTLRDACDGDELKAVYGWINNRGQHSDNCGFTALPGGAFIEDDGFVGATLATIFWSAAEGRIQAEGIHYDEVGAYGYEIDDDYGAVLEESFPKTWMFSVRCVKD